MTWGRWYWPAGLTAMLVAFLVPELYAVATNVRNTLSWYCWHELHVDVAVGAGLHSLAWWNSLLLWLLFVVAITAHIWWKQVL